MYRWQFYAAALFIFAIYIILQSRFFLFAPLLTIHSSLLISTREGEEVLIEGKTDRLSRVYLNGELLSLDQEGTFSQKLIAGSGITNVEIKVQNRFGKESKKVITILAQE